MASAPIKYIIIQMSTSPEKKKDQIYVGHLNRKLKEEDLKKEFGKFGKVNDVLLKNGFAFIVQNFFEP